MALKLGSLCSGAGGLDMVVERVFGAETVWHCELDPAASKVLATRWPGVPNHGDLINTDWSTVEPVDIICAGWPCQPFSLAGKREGHEDDRAIWPHIADCIRVVRPRVVVLENVTAVLVREFGRVANSLAAFGYDLRWTCLRASDVGAPHRRERLFVVAVASGSGWGMTEPQLLSRQSDAHRSNTADSPSNGRHEGWPESAGFVGGSDAALSGDGPVNLLPTPCAQQSGNTPENHLAKKPGRRVVTDLAILVENGLIASGGELLPTPTSRDHKGHNQRGDDTCLTGALLPTPNAQDGNGGDDLVTLAVKADRDHQWGKYAPAIKRWEQVLGQPAPSPTELNRNGNPRLNPMFSEWMMGWPTGWVTDVPGLSRNDQLRIIGNGVVDRCAKVALCYLLADVG